MPVEAAALADLVAKYTEMRRLRVEAVELPSADPRPALAALAARFPGSLREIDELPLEEITSRIAALESAVADAKTAEPWMEAIALFHELTRGALDAKRILAGRKDLDDEARLEFDRAVAALGEREGARAWTDRLDDIARPPRGRVTDLVFERLAARLAVTVAEARRLVFARRRVDR